MLLRGLLRLLPATISWTWSYAGTVNVRGCRCVDRGGRKVGNFVSNIDSGISVSTRVSRGWTSKRVRNSAYHRAFSRAGSKKTARERKEICSTLKQQKKRHRKLWHGVGHSSSANHYTRCALLHNAGNKISASRRHVYCCPKGQHWVYVCRCETTAGMKHLYCTIVYIKNTYFWRQNRWTTARHSHYVISSWQS